MIPPLNELGYLPPGLHVATLEEILPRFGSGSQEREAQGQSLQWLIPMCRRAGIERVIINGSFVTEKLEPGDVDCILYAGRGFDRRSDAARALAAGLPYLSIQILDDPEELAYYTEWFFGTDHAARPKGLVEVII